MIAAYIFGLIISTAIIYGDPLFLLVSGLVVLAYFGGQKR